MQDAELNQTIRDGSYFQEARKWYSCVYMAPISERFFYIVLTSIAVLTSLVTLIGLLKFLPVMETTPFIVRSANVAQDLPVFHRLAAERGEPTNDALRRFFVTHYVERRENYARQSLAENVRVIFNWSDSGAYELYRRMMDSSNPRSPIVLYQSRAERKVEVQSAEILPDAGGAPNAYVAKVRFVAYVISLSGVETSQWVADVGFSYEDAVVNQEDVHQETGRLKVTPMKFKVNSYVATERKDALTQ